MIFFAIGIVGIRPIIFYLKLFNKISKMAKPTEFIGLQHLLE